MGDAVPKKEKNAFWWTEKAAFEMLCTAADSNSVVMGRDLSDVWLFAAVEASSVALGQFKPNGRARKFYEHFLFGGGTPIEFDIADLLMEDDKARKYISKTISDKIRSKPQLGRQQWVPCDIESQLRPRPELYDKSVSNPFKDFEFPLEQKDYSVPDWRNATGSFFIEWEAVTSETVFEKSRNPMCGYQLGDAWVDSGTNARTRTPTPGPTGKSWFENQLPKYVAVWGLREYHWHPEKEVSDRADACLHEAGNRMNNSPVLFTTRNYWVFANPCLINLQSGLPFKSRL
jgi:hypothetical protein